MLLNMERVCKTYGDRTLLDNVTFFMKQGDRVGVVGVNGCGKSTFLRLAAGREKPDSGSVSYDPNVRLGYLPQDPAFDPENTVMEQVEAGLDKTAREVARYEAVEIPTRSRKWVLSPAGSASGWPWLPAWCTRRICCCWTSPPTIWTRR